MLVNLPTKTRKTFFALLAIIVLAACGKNDPISAEEQAVRYITGSGNRYWHIREVYVNSVRSILSASQLQYTKTFTRLPFSDNYSGSFTDSDGFNGTWKLESATRMQEIITNSSTPPPPINYTLNKLGTNEIDMSYTAANGDLVRLVYFGF